MEKALFLAVGASLQIFIAHCYVILLYSVQQYDIAVYMPYLMHVVLDAVNMPVVSRVGRGLNSHKSFIVGYAFCLQQNHK